MNNIDRIGVAAVNKECEQIGFAFREQPIADYGIDAIIEPRKDKYLSGRLIGVQIKSGSAYFTEIKDNSAVFRFDKTHYHYWTMYNGSVKSDTF